MKQTRKPPKFSHTSNSRKGMGDYYGTGVKNPMGKAIDVFAEKAPRAKDKGRPPKALA